MPNDEGPRVLLNTDGACFADLDPLGVDLDLLSNVDREAYRDANATTIAHVDAERVLVVAGPGTGKSHLFLERIRFWSDLHGTGKIYVATFVRKLVTDLRGDISKKLDEQHRERVDVSTLHTLARSLVERSGGTTTFGLRPHVRIIDGFWSRVVWDDVLAFDPDLTDGSYTSRHLEGQLHTEELDDSTNWTLLRATHKQLCQFYNAVGFAHLIALARQAAEETATLVEHRLWIIDEYQDFNIAEDHLIRVLINGANGVLMAGDDEQALYQTLKASSPDIIVGHYNDPTFAKAMLPYCSRCSYYVCQAASTFMKKHRTDDAIDKIYLPLVIDHNTSRVEVVATAAPSGAVAYVKHFLEAHSDEYARYLEARAAGKDADPFLLVLSPNGWLTVHKNTAADLALRSLIDSYAAAATIRSADYLRTLAYATAGWHLADNFAVRKVLHLEDFSFDEVHTLIETALREHRTLAAVVATNHTETIARIRGVADVLSDPDKNPAEKALVVTTLLSLHDADALAEEMTKHPLDRARARDQEDEEAIETAGMLPPVALMTMVGSKGLSAHHVVILGCDDVTMGRTPTLTFFVALTRARKSLHLVVAGKVGGTKAHAFVYDLPASCCTYTVFKTTGPSDTLSGPQALKDRLVTWTQMRRPRRL